MDKSVVIKKFIGILALIALFVGCFTVLFFTIFSFIPRIVLWFSGIVTGAFAGAFFTIYWIQDVLEE